eukprot:CAMPEP_0195577586 /NCGR_PEP_ID=MMETSP0814-20130614/10672_1 /TAXON_ID=97485 /ORGANISM="Prymnesium parvum, Strain Texoma1" /LENGTH=176 /DNA_ID=CAMNT_0040713999 /DNA_START=40 /DNA_END=567 /DNA_ORIENTATION=-
MTSRSSDEGNVRKAVPKHRTTLDDNAQQDEEHSTRLHEAEDEGRGNGEDVHERRHPSGRVRHPLELSLRPHEEASREQGDQISHGVLDPEGHRVGKREHGRHGDDAADAEANCKAIQPLLEGESGAHAVDQLLSHGGLEAHGYAGLVVQRGRLRRGHGRRGVIFIRLAAKEAQHSP